MKTWDEMSPRERDALVATEVMGFDVREAGAVGQDWCHPREIVHLLYAAHGPLRDTWDRVPRYSTDIAAAWDVIPTLERDDILASLVRRKEYDSGGEIVWVVELRQCVEPWGRWHAHRDTTSEAICLAALRAKGIEV